MNQTAPIAVGLYARTMLEGFDERDFIGNSTVFQSIFGRPMTGGKTLFSPNGKIIDIDILRGNERLAAMIRRGTEGRPITLQQDTSTQQFTSVGRVFPLIEETGNVTADEILNRMHGENPYEMKTRLERARTIGLEHHQEHIRRIVRTFEVLAAQSVLEGVQDALLNTTDTNMQYDFYRLATHIFVPSVKWDAATPVILSDIDAACRLIRVDGKVKPDVMLLGSGAMDAFLADTTVQALADNRRFELIEVKSTPVPAHLQFLVDAGCNARGRLRTPAGYELWMFTYVDGYTNSAGTFVEYLPTETVSIFSSQARCDRLFGPPELLPITPDRASFMESMFGISGAGVRPPRVKNASAVIRPEMFYFDAYASADWKAASVRTQAAPIFPTTMTDAFVTMNDVLT